VLVFITGWVAESFLSSTTNEDMSDRATRFRYRTALREAYAFGLACSSIGHIASWTLSLTAAGYPQIFAPEFAASFHPFRVFQNASPLSDIKITSIGEGALWFLQWDLFTGGAALLVWAATLHINAYAAHKKESKLMSTLLKATLVTMLAGPCGAALVLMCERDELVLESLVIEGKKNM